MSAEFVNLISQLHNERYVLQVNQVVNQKIPCGLFFGFSLPNPQDVLQNVVKLKNFGFNLKYLCVVDEEQKKLSEDTISVADVKAITLNELKTLPSKPGLILHFDYFAPVTFNEFFNKNGMDMFCVTNANSVDGIYHFVMNYLPELYETHETFCDEESKKVFRAYIKGRVTNRLKDFRFAPEPQYFLKGFLPSKNDIAIDGGAFDGANSKDFSMQGAKVYAFEMDADNYKKCLPLAEKYAFTVENLGLSDVEDTQFYSVSGGTGSHIVDDNRYTRGGGGY